MSRGLARSSASVATFLLAATAAILLAPAAWAVCNGTIGQAEIGAVNPSEALGLSAFGAKARIWVNNFGTNQHQTWRQTNVFQNSNNLVEVGWFVQANIDQVPHPYKTFINDGEASTVRFTGINISPRDSLHTFAVKDPDDDSVWRFLYDGSALGVDQFVSISNGHANASAGSERNCTSDSLWAQFSSLQYIKVKNQGDQWVDWLGPIPATVGDVSPYQYCSVSQTAFDVRQSC